MLNTGATAPGFRFTDADGVARDSIELAGRPLVLVFMRYAGCPICQLDLGAFVGRAAAFRDAGASLVLVVQSSPERAGALGQRAAREGALVACDPEGKLYDLYGLRLANPLQYAGPAVLRKLGRARAKGMAHGPREGRERQLPAAFVIAADGHIAHAHYGKNLADLPEPERLLSLLSDLGA